MGEILPPSPPIVPAISGEVFPAGPRALFDEFISLRRAIKTKEGYRRDILDFFQENIPAEVESLQLRTSLRAVQEWIDYMGKPVYQGGLALEKSTVFRKVAALRGYLDFCVEDGLIGANPCRSRRLVMPIPDPWEPELGLTTAQIRDMAEACRRDKRKLLGLRDLAILGLGFSCCLRVSEIAQASYHDFRPDRGAVKYVIPESKGGSGQKVGVSTEAKKLIEEWMSALGGVMKVIPDQAKDGTRRYPLFVSLSPRSRFQRLSVAGICKVIKERAEMAGIKEVDVHSHLLRHSGITHLIEVGWPLSKVQRHARHKDPKTTQQYFNLWHDEGRSPANDLGDIFVGKQVTRPEFKVG